MPKVMLNRSPDAVTGSQFCQDNISAPRAERQENILKEFRAGNVPSFFNVFKLVTLFANGITFKYLVSPDYICIGSDEDYVRMPMQPLTAQSICDEFDFSLPTRKMVVDIWKASINKLTPLPWGPPYDSSMMSMNRIPIHNSKIQSQLINKDKTALTSGHKKDVVLTNRLAPNNPKQRVAIFGWIQLNGEPIQGLQPDAHEKNYEDYSHGIRLVMNDVFVDGQLMRLQDVFADTKLASFVSDEGPLKFTKYS